jgi:acyl-CoA dehydrogenase
VHEDIAKAYCEIEQSIRLSLKAAAHMDKYGNKVTKDLIAAIKITAPIMACNVIDKAMQLHGTDNLTGDYFTIIRANAA